MSLGKENHRSKGLFSPHDIRGTYVQPDLPQLMWTYASANVVFIRLSSVNTQSFSTPFSILYSLISFLLFQIFQSFFFSFFFSPFKEHNYFDNHSGGKNWQGLLRLWSFLCILFWLDFHTVAHCSSRSPCWEFVWSLPQFLPSVPVPWVQTSRLEDGVSCRVTSVGILLEQPHKSAREPCPLCKREGDFQPRFLLAAECKQGVNLAEGEDSYPATGKHPRHLEDNLLHSSFYSEHPASSTEPGTSCWVTRQINEWNVTIPHPSVAFCQRKLVRGMCGNWTVFPTEIASWPHTAGTLSKIYCP